MNNSAAYFRYQNQENNPILIKKYGTGTRELTLANDKQNAKCDKCKQYGHNNQCENTDLSSKNSHGNERKSTKAISAVFYNAEFHEDDCYLNCGTICGLTLGDECLSFWLKKEIIVANQNEKPVLCCEYVKVTKSYCVFSVIPASQLIWNCNKVFFTRDGCEIFNKKKTLVDSASLVIGIFMLNTPTQLISWNSSRVTR